jgi:hypothetical protein
MSFVYASPKNKKKNLEIRVTISFFSSHTPEIFCLSETIIWVESGLTFEKSNTPLVNNKLPKAGNLSR